VAFFPKAAGLCADLGQIAKGLGIRFSKMVSYGNGCDVAAVTSWSIFSPMKKPGLLLAMWKASRTARGSSISSEIIGGKNLLFSGRRV